MSADAITRIEQLRRHKFSDTETARLREIGITLTKKKPPPRKLALPTVLWNRRKGFPRKSTTLPCSLYGECV
jgi:hypothetical protein